MEPDVDNGFDLFGSLVDDNGSSVAGMRHHKHGDLQSFFSPKLPCGPCDLVSHSE